MPDFEPIFESKENLYRETCPVLLEKGQLLQKPAVAEEEEPAEGRTCVRLTFRNIDDRAITALFVDLHVFDKVNNDIEVIRDHRYLVPVMGRDERFGEDTVFTVNDGAVSFSVAIKKVEFEGEDIWEGSASFLFEGIPAASPLEETLTDETLLEQYYRDYNEQKKGDTVAQVVPTAVKDLWICTCGEINHKDEEACRLCAVPFALQTSWIEDETLLPAHLEAYEKAEAEKAEKARLEAERKAEEERKAAEEAARKAEEERLAALAAAKRRKRNRIIFLSISIPLVLLIIGYILLLNVYLIPQEKYDKAEALYTEGKYDEAVEAFAALENYSDAADRIPEVKYAKAMFLLESGKYDEAIAAFELLGSYEDAAQQITEANYRKAVLVQASGAYVQAMEQLEALGEYKDCAERIEQCHNALAQKALEEEDIPGVQEHYDFLTEAHQHEIQLVYGERGLAAYREEDDERAWFYYDLLTEKELQEAYTQAKYERAVRRMEDKAYDEALELFTELKTYEDSEERIRELHYLKAEALYKQQKYPEAIAEYEASENFGNAAQQIEESNYHYGLQLLYSGRVVDAYNTLYPLRNRDEVFYLLVSESQFYIYVYDPGVGPNPLYE